MMEGVKVQNIKRYSDDRGFFSEMYKLSAGWFNKIKQISYTESYPGIIKAFHAHKKQNDIWFCARGMLQVALVDMRKGPNYFVNDTIFMGEDEPKILFIPKGVFHGYKVLGNKKASLIYLTDEEYNPEDPDEIRASWDTLRYDWETKFK